MIALETRTWRPGLAYCHSYHHSNHPKSPLRWSILALRHSPPSICSSTDSIFAGPPHAVPATLYSNRSPIRCRVTLATTDFKLFLEIDVSIQIVPSGLSTARRL